jgi:hypothetical protein
MFFMTAKTDKVRIEKIGGKVLKQAMLLIGLVSMIMFLSGNWGAWADTPENLNVKGSGGICELAHTKIFPHV